jgi:hypothetical protein
VKDCKIPYFFDALEFFGATKDCVTVGLVCLFVFPVLVVAVDALNLEKSPLLDLFVSFVSAAL